MILEVNKLSKRFKGVNAVQDLSFSVQQGEIIGLIGPNGAGKSTVFDMISATRPPDGSSPLPNGGDIAFNGTSIVGRTAYDICRLGIARTFQITKVIQEMSVLENVMVSHLFGKKHAPSRSQLREEAERICRFLEIEDKMDTPAEKLTIVERKRLEMARALGTKPSLLLLDEVMAGLRPAEIDRACGIVKKIRDSGVTIIVVEHVMKAIMAISDRLIVMDSGRKIAEGAPGEIVNNPLVIEAYFGKEER
jgi:branched-chain amino acid transport system ATP-binding protein